ncbi:sialate O-acetylesterase [Halosquirtibacter laminarini]|uniref:Sialate O-acetylesterase n=1 Tax=Halosquirtibacter laminarini TaxID=3374600 RepID=A0AC61NLH9_9BACT|nr:sialate O-acetylesterase [Prolixibacteraceae bacterium]
MNRHQLYLPSKWKRAQSNGVGSVSAIAYYFANTLEQNTHIPTAIIVNTIGGSPTEAWIRYNTLTHDANTYDFFVNWKGSNGVDSWVKSRAAKNTSKATNPHQQHPYHASYLYQTSMEMLSKYPISGVLWYQGESNAENPEMFAHLFNTLKEDWRSAYARPQLPFYYVQLSGLNRPSWSYIRNVQTELDRQDPYAHMVVSYDYGNANNVHPTNKQPIGERLAKQALYFTYNKRSVTPYGPLLEKIEQKDSQLIVSFEYGKGLHPKEGKEVIGFEIAGEDRIFHPAQTSIKGDKVILINSKVTSPKYARYAWAPYTKANLVNGAGLPCPTWNTLYMTTDKHLFVGDMKDKR